jgi:hypothetical protein
MKDEVSEVGFKRCYIGDNEGDWEAVNEREVQY